MEKLSLREFIDRRESEIKEIRAALLLELKELKAARGAIDASHPLSGPTERRGASGVEVIVDSAPTIKEMVLSTLLLRQKSATSDQISDWIKEDFGKFIERSSLSPQLSRLRVDGKLDLDKSSGEWRLTERTQHAKEFDEVASPSSLDNSSDLDDSGADLI